MLTQKRSFLAPQLTYLSQVLGTSGGERSGPALQFLQKGFVLMLV